MSVAEAAGAAVYPSKADTWLVVVLWASIVVLVLSPVIFWIEPGPPAARLGMTLLFLGTAGLVLWVLRGTRYELYADRLVVRSGPFRWRIPLAAIQEVRPSRSPLSGPALSLDRLLIRYQGSRLGVMISPEREEAFLQDLASRAPHLEVRGDRVERVGS